MLKPGLFRAKVIRTDFIRSPRQGTPGIQVKFLIEYPEDPNRMPDNTTGTIWLTDRASGVARKSLEAMGFDVDKDNFALLKANPEMLSGKECQVEIAEKEFRDNITLEVAWINPLPNSGGPDEDERITKMLRAAKHREEPPKEILQKPVEPEKDDLPF